MATPVLAAELRKAKGKNQMLQVRRSGHVPGVVYSKGKKTKQVLLNEREINKLLSMYGQSLKIALNLEGEKSFAIIREIQRGSVNSEILHVDFQSLDENEKVKVQMPIQVINREAVESSVRFIQLNMNEIEIQTYPRYLPDKIELDAKILNEQDVLTIGDLDITSNEHIEILEDKGKVIASFVYAPTKVEADGLEAEA